MKTTAILENATGQPEFIERRHKKDWVVRSVSIIAVIGWLCAFVSLTLIDEAKPETEDLFSRFFNYPVRSYWDLELLRIGVTALSISFATCVVGFLVNMSRHNRKTDRYNKAIIILGTVSVIMLAIFSKKLI